jgi:hypothetical protein
MITYFYWFTVAVLAIGVLWLGIAILKRPAGGLAAGAVVLLAGWVAYSFHFQQIFVKRWGGVMHLSVPEGHRHLGATWKDDNLWVESYDPATNTCEFREYSKGNLLQGRVIIKNCNPLVPAEPPR